MRDSPYRRVRRSTPGRGKSGYQSFLFGRIMFGVSGGIREARAAGIEKRDGLAGAHVLEVTGSQIAYSFVAVAENFDFDSEGDEKSLEDTQWMSDKV